MKQKFTASIWQEGEFIAQCVEVDIASQGKTEGEALNNLREALELHFTPPVATVVLTFDLLRSKSKLHEAFRLPRS